MAGPHNEQEPAALQMDPSEMWKAFQTMQLDYERLRNQVLIVQTGHNQQAARVRIMQEAQKSGKTASLVPTVLSGTTGQVPPSALMTAASDDEDAVLTATVLQDLKGCARVYSLMHAPWILPCSLTVPRPPIDPNGPERWVNKQSRADGIVAELFDMAPKSLHALLATNDRIASEFRNLVNRQRSQSLLNAKDNIEYIFSAYPEATIKLIKGGKYDNPDVARLLKGDFASYKTKWPPIMFPPDRIGDLRYLYKNDVFIKIARVDMYGRTALRNGDAPPRTNSTAKKWGITRTTPGLIARCVQVARFLLSPDTKLEPMGNVTKVPYFTDFEYMKERTMSTGPIGGSKERVLRELFAWWDMKVFGTVTDTRGDQVDVEIPVDVLEADRLMELAWDHPDEAEYDSDDESRAAVEKGKGVVRSRGEYIEIGDDEGEFQGSDTDLEDIEEMALHSHSSAAPPLSSASQGLHLPTPSELIPINALSLNDTRRSVPPPSDAAAFAAQMSAVAFNPPSEPPAARPMSAATLPVAQQSSTIFTEPALPPPVLGASPAPTALSEAAPAPATKPKRKAGTSKPPPRAPRATTTVNEEGVAVTIALLPTPADYADTLAPIPAPRRTTRCRVRRCQ